MPTFDESHPVLALRMVEQALRVGGGARQQLGRAARRLGKTPGGFIQLAAPLGNLADQVQRARPAAQ